METMIEMKAHVIAEKKRMEIGGSLGKNPTRIVVAFARQIYMKFYGEIRENRRGRQMRYSQPRKFRDETHEIILTAPTDRKIATGAS